MAEENQEQNIDDTQQDQKDVVDDKQTDDIKPTDDTKEDKEGFFASTMKYIRDKIKSGDKDTESDDDVEATLSGADIPDEFSNAAESLGWSGDEIIKFASKGNSGKPYTDEELVEMIPDLLAQLEEDEEGDLKDDGQDKVSKPDGAGKTKDEDGKGKSKLAEIPDELREQLKKEIIDELGLGDVKDEIKSLRDERQTREEAMVLIRANELFDNASKEFEIFGKTDELPKYPAGKNKGQLIPSSPAFKARSEVFGDALAFMSHYKMNVDEAMAKAISTYAGKNLKDSVKRSVIKDLKSHEKNLSGSRTSKEMRKNYSSKREEDIDFIRGLQEASGQQTS